MIRMTTEDGFWLYTQRVHAFIAGQIAQAWQLSPIDPLPELLLTATIHDDGWAERDEKPLRNSDGLPRTFTELDLDDHILIWERGIRRITETNLYAGLLVSLHSTSLYERRLKSGRDDDVPQTRARIQRYIAEQLIFQADLEAFLAAHYGKLVQNPKLQHNRELLQVWDGMSLLLCVGAARDVQTITVGDLSIEMMVDDTGILWMEPWPFDPESDTLTVYGEARFLPHRIFETDAALQASYAATYPQIRTLIIKRRDDV